MKNNKKRLFSIPFNGVEADNFISLMDGYKENIESVFLAPPLFSNNHINIAVDRRSEDGDQSAKIAHLLDYEKNCYDFLDKTRPSKRKFDFKRLITVNSAHYPFSDLDIQFFVKKDIARMVKDYEIEGLILTDYNMAKFIHTLFPNLELHTSCNCFQWSVRQMELWRKYCGISVFNPPREILRSPAKLKEMHDAGFKLKCLLNEACLFGCPQMLNHCMMRALNKMASINCSRYEPSNIFKGNYIVPRWLDRLDEYVDIYKISGRNLDRAEDIFKILDAYITESEDVYLKDLLNSGVYELLGYIPSLSELKASDVPDKVLTCECKECDTCNLCSKLVEQRLNKKSS